MVKTMVKTMRDKRRCPIGLTRERDIAAYLKKRVTEIGGIYRKVSWEGRSDAPDYLIMANGLLTFVETKAPGQKPRASQMREFKAIWEYAHEPVFVVTSKEDVDVFIRGITGVEFFWDAERDLTYRRFIPCPILSPANTSQS